MPTNRLIHSTSPYLLQHAHNPVDCFPWGDEALAKARAEDKPVFLSLGYSACHWCHVMERESFENPAIAEVLNRHFICIKVDREERPDLDETYMLATQLMTGRGGWPNSVWLLPDGRPWYAGTYFPPVDQPGRIGFKSLLLKLTAIWNERRAEVEEQARVLTDAIRRHAEGPAQNAGPQDVDTMIAHVLAQLQDTFDARQGGFGDAPKFPPHAALALLLDQQQTQPDAILHQMISATLHAMQQGGIHDHIGGGFHRYATDAAWLVPHFEKMLYDNAQLAWIYTEAWRRSGEAIHRATAEDILDWVVRDMTDARGGFHSALDADSEGEEGRFYVWSHTEIMQLLGPEDGVRFCAAYHIQPGGNFHEEASGNPTGLNIPHLTEALDQTTHTRLAESRRKLRATRDQRVWPGRDDKIIASWNGLMIRALHHAAVHFDRADYRDAAIRAADFMLTAMWSDHTLSRSWRAGACSGPGFLEDYAAFALALLDLSEMRDDRWSNAAREVIAQLIARFRDPASGALVSSGAEHGAAWTRMHDVFDQAMPSATSLALEALRRGAAHLQEPAWLEIARAAAAHALVRASRMPSGCCALLLAARPLPGPLTAAPAPPRETCDGGTCEVPG